MKKRRVLSLLMAILMVISMLPTSALAASSGKSINVKETVKISGKSVNVKLSGVPDGTKLKLAEAKKSSYNKAVSNAMGGDFEVVLAVKATVKPTLKKAAKVTVTATAVKGQKASGTRLFCVDEGKAKEIKNYKISDKNLTFSTKAFGIFVLVKPVVAPVAPVQETPAQEAPVQETPAQEEPAQEEPAQEEPAQEEPAQEEPAQEEPVQEEPVQEEPAQEEPAEEEPAQEEPAQEEPAEEEPAEEEPVQEEPAQEEPAEEEPAEEEPAEEEPTEEEPTEEEPVEEEPTQEEPTQEEEEPEDPTVVTEPVVRAPVRIWATIKYVSGEYIGEDEVDFASLNAAVEAAGTTNAYGTLDTTATMGRDGTLSSDIALHGNITLELDDKTLTLDDVSITGGKLIISGTGTIVGYDANISNLAIADGYMTVDNGNGTCSVMECFTATFDFDNGSDPVVYKVQKVGSDAQRTVNVPADPAKAADAQYTYAFAGWDPAITGTTVVVNGNVIYTAQYDRTENVAVINNTYYTSFEAAFAAAQDGDTITLLKDCAGNGIIATQGKFTTGLTVDFNGHTYTVDGTTVGSSGTETQAFQLLKDNKITFKNGTIYSEKALMLVQNYSDLTLDHMTLTLNNENYASAYTLSNNNGDVVIKDTTINANPAGAFAFDVCRYSSYPSVHVTVQGSSVINGDIEVSATGGNAADGFSLMLAGGTFNREIILDPSAKAAMAATPEKAKIQKADAVTIDAPADYKWADNGDGTSSLALKEYVVQVGTVKYETLQEAINAAASGNTITLLDNLTLSSVAMLSADKALTLDLNGHTLSSTVEDPDAGTRVMTVEAGSLTVKSGTITGRVNAYDNGTLTIAADATINGAVVVWGDGEGASAKKPTLNVYGTINGVGYHAISTNGNDKSGAIINIYSGAAVTANGEIAIYQPSGNLTISGGTITGTTAVYTKSGTLTISGGTLTGNGPAAEFSHNGNGANATGDALVVENTNYPNGAPVVTITGGAFNSTNGKGIGSYADESNGVTELASVTSTSDQITILDEEKWASNSNGGFDLVLREYVAKIGETKFETLQAALDAANSGDIIEIIASEVELSAAAVIPEGVTLKGQGADATTVKITTSNGNGIKLTNPNVTISDLKIDGSAITSGGYKSVVNIEADGCVIDGVVIRGGGTTTWNSSILVERVSQTGTFTVRNSDITGSFRGVLRESCNANIVIENCKIDAVYPFNIDGGNGGAVTVSGSELHGWTSYSGVTKVTFTDCQFSKGNSGYDCVAAYVETEFNNCTFDSDFDVYAQTSPFNFYFNDCVKNGEAVTRDLFMEQFPDDPDVWNKCATYVNGKLVGAVAAIGTDGTEEYREYKSLQAALDAAHEMTGAVTVTLIADVTEVAVIHQKAGLDLTLEGSGKTITGQIYIDGDGRYEGTDTLTIQNTKFAYDASTYDDAFIDVPSTKTAGKPYTTGKYNYAHNITVSGCEFAGEGETTVAFRVASGAGANKVTLTGNTVTGGHSFAQLVGVKDLTISGCTVTGTKNGINISGGDGTGTISNNTLIANATEGYTLRLKDACGMNVTLSGNTFSGGEGLINSSSAGGKITVVDGKYAGPLPTEADKFTVQGGVFSVAPNTAVCAEGLYPIANTDEETKDEYPYTVGAAVAAIGNVYYATFEEAVEARANDDDVITLLADIADAYTLESGTLKVAHNGKELTVIVPEGKVLKKTTEEGVTTYKVADAVAKIGDTLYASLAEAVAAVPEDGTETTITMIDNEAINVVGYAVTIPANKNVILDLNGKTIAGVCTEEGTSALIRNLGTLTITDSGSGGKLTIGAEPTWTWDGSDDYTGSYASNLIRNEKTLIVNGGTLYNASTGSAVYAIDNYSAGTVTINGGTVDAKKASAIRMFYNNGGAVTVTGGTIGHYNDDDDCSYMGIQVMAGTNADVTVSGGTIAGMYALYTNGTGDSSVTISDGVFDGYVGFAAAAADNISISGGKFVDWVGTWGDHTGFITGGLFAVAPETTDCGIDTEGNQLYPIVNTDEATKVDYPYTVGTAVAELNGKYYATFEDAAADRTGDDDVITLLADIADAYTLESGTLKVAHDGKNLTVNAAEGKALMMSIEDGVTTYSVKEPVAKIGDVLYGTLQSALDAAHEMTGAVTVTLIADVTEVAVIHQKAGLDLTLEGSGKTITGQIYIDGDGRYEGTDTLTIQNTKFAYDASTYDDAFIDVPSTKTAGKPYTTGKYNYAHNITVSGCEFAGEGTTTVAFRVASGAGANKVTLTGNTVTGGHSFAQLVGVKDLTISGCTVTGTKNGINISGGEGIGTISNNTITDQGYTLRLKDASGMNVTLSGNTFSGAEGIVSVATSGGKITVVDGKYAGPLPTEADKFTVQGGVFSVAPSAEVCAEGLYPIANTDEATKDDYPYTVGAAVAAIGSVYYATLAEAFAAAQDGETITLLKDVEEESNTISKSITLDLNEKTLTGRLTAVAGTVTVDNGTIVGRVDGYDSAKLTIAEDTVINGQLIVWGDGTEGDAGCKTPEVTVNGTITNTGDAAISTNGTDMSGAKIIIGATAKITSTDDIAIFLPSGNLTVNGGTITGTTAIYQKSGSVTVNGGTITGNGAAAAYSFNGSGANATGDAIVVESCGYPNGTPETSIKGGTITSENGLQVGYYENDEEAELADVTATDNTLTIPTDYKWVETETAGTYKLTPKDYVAQIGEAKYETLQDAINAAVDGDTITLLCDLTLSSVAMLSENKTITLDLNEHALNSTVEDADAGTRVMTVEAGSLTVKNGTITGRMNAYDNGTLTIAADATINGAVVVWGDGEGASAKTPTLNVYGTINGINYQAISTNGNDKSGANINIYEGATVTAENNLGIYLPSGNLTVNGGTITGTTAIYQKSGSVTVNGGTITGNGAKTDYSFNGSGANATGDAIVVESCGYPNGAPETAIKDGTITSENGLQVGYYENSDGVEFADVTATDNTLTIPEDYKWVATETAGTYKLTKKDYVAQIGETKYETLEEAFAAAQDGDTITLLKDCSGNGIVAPQGKFNTNGLTVDFGGFTYTVNGNLVGSTGTETQAFQLLKDNKITFKNGTIYSEKALFLVQNYSDLTLDGMTLTLNNANYAYGYTLSNNNGDVVIKDTTINANPTGAFAFDVCRNSSYPSVHVTVQGNSVINGNIEVSASGSDPKDGLSLTLEGGTYTGNIVLDSSVTPIIDENPDLARIIKAKTLDLAAPDGYSWGEYDATHDTLKSNFVAKNLQTQAKYTTLNGALAAARSGETVVPLTNITDEAYILVMNGVTLDLNGFNVTGATLFYVTGTLVDSGATRGRFSAEAYYLGKSVGSEFPIYDSSTNAYALFDLSIQQWDESSQYGYSYRLRKNGNERADATSMISNSANHGRVAVAINVRWTEGSGISQKDNVKTIAFADSMLDMYAGDPTQLYRITFTGLEDIDGSVTATPTFIVYDDFGAVMMTLAGETWTIK